jgi:hypothetical protein
MASQWNQGGSLIDSQTWSFTLVESRAGSRTRWPWTKSKEITFEIPFGVWKAPGFLGEEGHGSPTQFFLVLGVSYFLLLEYHKSRGMPMEGKVITPKAAQSSCGGKPRAS